mmetsp:Transcript_569/g.1267  ORF Transcript_569/g.1267 Transcript_569/m.1267 type:complete len:205 (+) Transcript_569:4086-4700(+)
MLLQTDPRPQGVACQHRQSEGDFEARQIGGHPESPRLAPPDRRAVGEGGGRPEGSDLGRLREEEQRQRRLSDAIRNQRHHPGDGHSPSFPSTTGNCRDRKAGSRPAAGHCRHHPHRQRPRRRNSRHHTGPPRAAGLCLQDRLEGPCDLRHLTASPNEAHLRQHGRHQGVRVHVCVAEEHPEKVHCRGRPPHPDRCVHLRSLCTR